MPHLSVWKQEVNPFPSALTLYFSGDPCKSSNPSHSRICCGLQHTYIQLNPWGVSELITLQ